MWWGTYDEKGDRLGVEQRGGVPAEALWDHVEQHGGLPWDDGSTNPMLELTFMTMPQVPRPPEGASAEKGAAYKALVAQKQTEMGAVYHARSCTGRVEARRRVKQKAWPGPRGPGGDELSL